MVSRRSRDKQTLGTRIISLESETAKNKRDSSGEFIEEDDSARQTVFTEDLGNIERIFATNNLAISAPGGVQINGHQIDPAGNVVMTARATAPGGWLLCEGQAVSRTVFAVLFSAIGVQYGGGDGSTTFNIPDMRGRVPTGRDAGQGEFSLLGGAAGEKTVTLSIAQMPSHSHQWQAAGTTTPGTTANWDDIVGGNSSALGTGPPSPEDAASNAIKARGGNAAHNNLQPYRTLNFIIKT